MHGTDDIGTARDRWLHLLLITLVSAVIAWSWFGARDRLTWWLESFPVFLAAPVLFFTGKRFPLSRLAYVLIALHMAVLLVGAHYTYEHVPLFDTIKQRFYLKRNDYDRLGHLMQGFVPAVIAREIFLRRQVVKSAGWRVFLVLCVCMAISACYELIEWCAAELLHSNADAFLGTQGDPFDTDWDMFCALVGASAASLITPWFHDREIARIPGERQAVL